MVDLSGGQDGPLEHAFSNTVFIVPGIVVVGLTVCWLNGHVAVVGLYFLNLFIYLVNMFLVPATQVLQAYHGHTRSDLFFGYKLYKSIKEKEVKREEKKKLKQMKKKK